MAWRNLAVMLTLAAIIATLFLGLVADRFCVFQKIIGVLILFGGALMYLAPNYAEAGETDRKL
jgi:uncharacterized membrane protein